MTSRLKQIEEYQEQHKRILFKAIDSLEQRISTLEKVIAKHQLRVADIVTYIDKKAEQHGS